MINPNPELEDSADKPWMLNGLNSDTFSKIDQ